MKNHFKLLYQTCVFVIMLSAWSCIYDPPIIPPKAEITNIYSITDNSAVVDVKVTRQSNASSCSFGLSIDSISDDGLKHNITDIKFNGNDNGSNLKELYTIPISNLKSKTKYILQLGFGGMFDIGGPNELRSFTIGEEKTFTTQ